MKITKFQTHHDHHNTIDVIIIATVTMDSKGTMPHEQRDPDPPVTNGSKETVGGVRAWSPGTAMKLQNFMEHTPSSASSNETTPSDELIHSSMEMTFKNIQETTKDHNSNKTSDDRENNLLEGDSVTLKEKIKESLHLELLKNTPNAIYDITEVHKMAPNPRPQDVSELSVVHGDGTSSDIATRKDEYVSDEKKSNQNQRTINEIKTSLEKKVRKLREERGVLEKTIQITQEGDVLFSQESFKSDILGRKEKLKRIISELRKKLEDQGKRLQGNYNTILAIQRNVLRCRSFTMKRKFITDSVVKESPF
ncbi:hypothetical protein BSL78_06048 [Apostichopus japonicus]|uniref:Uncharacterized protein n=1 Tax=Stichopus japonicus TaxID=307972 RepID=A0A2G8L9X3_STIJA|nr:hypothetical protein BSL78_06048 [Apostichopus japonicus]